MQADWADQCSSDEEEEEEVEVVQPISDAAPSNAPTESSNQGNEAESEPIQNTERVFNYPSEPPYSAYVGNLHFNVDKDILAESIMGLTKSILQHELKIVQSRVVMDREDRTRSRGFGYVEVETVLDLQKLMELNDCDGAVISGRKLHLDVSTTPGNSRRSGNRNSGSNNNSSRSFGTGTEIDGSKFRQGKYVKKDAGKEANDVPKERPVLILKPRTKAAENGAGPDESESNLSASSSNIFGNAKARDEVGWHERRQSDTAPPAATVAPSGEETTVQPRRDSRGGRGRGGTGRGSARGGGRSNGRGESGRGESGRGESGRRESGRGGSGRGESGRGDRDESGRGGRHKNEKRADKTKQPAPVAPVVPPKSVEAEKKPAKANNAFAALALDDSDSD